MGVKLPFAVLALILAVASIGTATAAKGGPDSFGYTFVDNNTAGAGAPVYKFDDISDTGEAAEDLSDCDDCTQPDIPLGFVFNFYGKKYTHVNPSTNGLIRFDDESDDLCCDDPGGIPTDQLEGPGIFGWWMDWDLSECGDVFYETLGSSTTERFVLQYTGCANDSPTSDVACQASFEIVLFADTDEILFLYEDTVFSPDSNGDCDDDLQHPNDQGGRSTIGIQQNANVGLEYSENGSREIEDGLAVCFRAPGQYATLPCQPTKKVVTIEDVKPNISGAVSGAVQTGAAAAQANRERAAANAAAAAGLAPLPAPTITAPRTGDLGSTGTVTVRPPSTGDGGLLDAE